MSVVVPHYGETILMSAADLAAGKPPVTSDEGRQTARRTDGRWAGGIRRAIHRCAGQQTERGTDGGARTSSEEQPELSKPSGPVVDHDEMHSNVTGYLVRYFNDEWQNFVARASAPVAHNPCHARTSLAAKRACDASIVGPRRTVALPRLATATPRSSIHASVDEGGASGAGCNSLPQRSKEVQPPPSAPPSPPGPPLVSPLAATADGEGSEASRSNHCPATKSPEGVAVASTLNSSINKAGPLSSLILPPDGAVNVIPAAIDAATDESASARALGKQGGGLADSGVSTACRLATASAAEPVAQATPIKTASKSAGRANAVANKLLDAEANPRVYMLRQWASLRLQTLYRTMVGMMKHRQAYLILLREQLPDMAQEDIELLADAKFTCLGGK